MTMLVSLSEARSLGLKRYFTGVACRNRHISERFTASAHCVDCSNAAKKAALEKHPERIKKYSQTYNKKHPEKRKEIAVRYRESHREVMRQRTKNWQDKNKEPRQKYLAEFKKKFPNRVKQYSVKYRQRHPDKVLDAARCYKKKNPKIRNAHDRNRRARHAAALGRHNYSDVINILKLQRFKCAYCRVDTKDRYDVDHIIPLSKGGTNFPSNLQVLCPSCNRRKYIKDPVDFARELGRLL